MRARLAILALLGALAAVLAGFSFAQPTSRTGGGDQAAEARAGVRLLKLGTFAQPTFLTSPPGDRRRRFVTEQAGRIRIVQGSRALGRPFLDITDRVQTGGESGLLSMAFAPDFARSRRYYVYYVDNAGFLVVDGFRASAKAPNRTQPGSRRNVIREPHRRGNHKGGQIAFGRDGKLYIGFGDGGGAGDPDENGQNLGRRLGKLLRISPRPGGGYRIPRDNPFVGRAGARGEIFAYGLRNPYRFSFDRRTGDLTIGDVGQDAREEIDFVPAVRRVRRPRGGANFGWSSFEGSRRYSSGPAPGHLPPVLERTHAAGSCSITGGYVIRDRALGGLYGAYVYGDLCDSRLRVARLRARGARGDRALGPRVSTLVSFGEDGRGRVHAISLGGAIFRLTLR
ncbi:MAG: PQQ-dependent sugar dehydrogenase [Actinomycetota bacterium]|nr:PQQ-dependent sugar dehydrogenase [Actinomycetota bacterium]MDQ3645060.1 PQQ-dependent sugar dehydrogenase [Actinomycetota bacterium]